MGYKVMGRARPPTLMCAVMMISAVRTRAPNPSSHRPWEGEEREGGRRVLIHSVVFKGSRTVRPADPPADPPARDAVERRVAAPDAADAAAVSAAAAS